MHEERLPEFIISLIGTILGTMGLLLMFAIALLPAVTANVQVEGTTVGIIMFNYFAVVRTIVAIINWFGTFKLKNNTKFWGIYFLVSGIVSIHLFNIIVGGMLLFRKPKQAQ
ncbi:MAG: DUF4064 domain-containing protein [Sporolactobacillus sp.]